MKTHQGSYASGQRRVGTLVLCAVSACTAIWTLSVQPATAESGCPVAGRYAVIGMTPRNFVKYSGEATISARGSGCAMTWSAPNTSDGTGDYTNGVLTIRFTLAESGESGVVKYTRAPNGELHGVWWLNRDPGSWGTESLVFTQ